jgi:anaerobic ribonucleoside-triphosphate reductase activating protein
MKYAGLIENDFSAAPGVSVSFYLQGCPHHCPGCHNPETWDFDGGIEFENNTLDKIINALNANGIKRSLSVLGGEPLCPENEFLTYMVIRTVKEKLPETKIYLWTGYTYEELKEKRNTSKVNSILEMIDCLIDGPYIELERDITLPMRGSTNQRIIYLDKNKNI